MVELKDPDVKSNFLPELTRRARDRPNIHVLKLELAESDFLRFDAHLNVRGNARVAAQLDRAIRHWQ